MRIGIYAPNMAAGVPSGVERYVTELVRALLEVEGGVEYVLFTDRESWPDSTRLRLIRLPTMGWLDRIRYDRWRFARIARRERLDVLHCPKSYVPAGLDCPAVATIHDVIFLRYPDFYPFWWRWYWKSGLRQSVRRAAVLACVSETTARDVEAFLPEATGKTLAVYSGVAASFGAIDWEDAAAARRRLGVDRPYFFFAGNLTVRKNVPTLLAALDMVRSRRACSLVLAGAKDYGARGLIAMLGNRDGVKYLGHVDHESLAALYGGAVAMVYPSIYEGFGLPALEAMACGCPVIAASAGALPEVVGDAGILVDPRSPAEFAEAMESVMADNGLREELVRRGRSRVGRFSWRRTAERMVEVYKKAAGMGTR